MSMAARYPFTWTVLLICGAGLVGCQCETITTPVRTAELAELDRIVQSGADSKLYPGALLIVGRGDTVRWAQVHGRETYEPDSAPIQFNTLFDLASVSKLVGTTSAAMLHIEDGKLRPDDTVASHFPGFEANGKQNITIRELMCHVSGLPAYTNKDKVEKTRKADETPADSLARTYAEMPLAYPTGTKYLYSCLNFQTMARVNENIAGRRMEDLLIERVYGPLNMNDTRYTLTPEQRARTAPTHRDAKGDLCRGETHDPLARYHQAAAHCPGNAGLFSTGPDLVNYCRMILNKGTYRGQRIFEPETIAAATCRQTPADIKGIHALGFDIFNQKPYATDLHQADGGRVVGHFGFTGTLIWMDQRTGSYFIFLTNRTFPSKPGDIDATPDITPIRKAIAETVLRSIPEYAPAFTTTSVAFSHVN